MSERANVRTDARTRHSGSPATAAGDPRRGTIVAAGGVRRRSTALLLGLLVMGCRAPTPSAEGTRDDRPNDERIASPPQPASPIRADEHAPERAPKPTTEVAPEPAPEPAPEVAPEPAPEVAPEPAPEPAPTRLTAAEEPPQPPQPPQPDAPALDTCGELRADREDEPISACKVVDTIQVAGRTVELLELELDDPAADSLREVYIAMDDDEGTKPHFEAVVDGHEVPGETVDFRLGPLEARGATVVLAYRQTITTYVTEGPGPLGEADKEVHDVVMVCDLAEQLCEAHEDGE